jgi:hypothetical protein
MLFLIEDSPVPEGKLEERNQKNSTKRWELLINF